MSFLTRSILPALLSGATLSTTAVAQWTDITDASGLGQHAVSRVKLIDLNDDSRPDAVIIPESKEAAVPVVYLQEGTAEPGALPEFRVLENTGLPAMTSADILAFADLDNDGHTDAVIGRYLDIYQEGYSPPADSPTRTGWLPGNGDGTFGESMEIKEAPLATTRSLAVGDVNMDGLPDLFLGNWYERYFSGYECFANDLLLQVPAESAPLTFVRWPMPDETRITSHVEDLGGRPTYGVALPRLDDGLPMLLELNYGRRWNRLYQMQHREPIRPPRKDMEEPAPFVLQDERARGAHLVRQLRGENIAAAAGVDGDAIRHGRHPKWPQLHAEAQPRSLRGDEEPFRANGNTFDAAVGDIDNDGDFDLFLSTIIHAWAGESSDHSRFLVSQLEETGELRFLSFKHLSVDRIPDMPEPGEPLQRVHTNYNQGDIYAELADLNHDGRLDLILCSSQYPDPPPHDERLRIYLQQFDGRFRDTTHELGPDVVGSGMPAIADLDNDGDLDLMIGQSFNRMTREQRRAAAISSGALSPEAPEDARPKTRVRLFRNNMTDGRASIMLDIAGNPQNGVSRDAYGTIVRLTADLDGNPETPDVRQLRQVLGPAGHAGKQQALTLHFGLGEAGQATSIEVFWPGSEDGPEVYHAVRPGRYQLERHSLK